MTDTYNSTSARLYIDGTYRNLVGRLKRNPSRETLLQLTDRFDRLCDFAKSWDIPMNIKTQNFSKIANASYELARLRENSPILIRF